MINAALPGLIGPEGVDPEQLKSVGSTVGLIGAAVLLYSAVSIVRAVDDGVRLIYGVQYDPRSFAVKTLRLLGYLLLLSPLVALSYVGSSAAAGLFRAPVLTGPAGPMGGSLAMVGAGLLVGILLNSVVIMIIISRLGGVRPPRWRWRASLMAGTALEVVKVGATSFVAFTISNPRYLSFGSPVAMLLLFYAMASVVLIAAAFVATANEQDPVNAARREQLPTAPRTSARLARASTGRPQALASCCTHDPRAWRFSWPSTLPTLVMASGEQPLASRSMATWSTSTAAVSTGSPATTPCRRSS